MAGRAGHVASREWRVHGGAVNRAHGEGEAAGRWTGSTGPWWTGHAGAQPRSIVDRARGRRAAGCGGAASRDGGAIAAGGGVAGTALWGETGQAEGITGVGTTRRGRGTAHLRETSSAERSATAAAARLTAAARFSAKRTRGGSGARLGFRGGAGGRGTP